MMKIELDEDMQKCIQKLIDTGKFASVDEVIEAALELLQSIEGR